ncbi:MAG: hypothetical protein NTZ81_04350 [Actinobacteria bacterium]|nr:hypothetical protein [Actinomycetota bacterium]
MATDYSALPDGQRWLDIEQRPEWEKALEIYGARSMGRVQQGMSA